jgi:hypothetical protein
MIESLYTDNEWMSNMIGVTDLRVFKILNEALLTLLLIDRI